MSVLHIFGHRNQKYRTKSNVDPVMGLRRDHQKSPNVTAIHQTSWHFTQKCWWRRMKHQAIIKVDSAHPLKTLNVCLKWDNSVCTKPIDIAIPRDVLQTMAENQNHSFGPRLVTTCHVLKRSVWKCLSGHRIYLVERGKVAAWHSAAKCSPLQYQPKSE